MNRTELEATCRRLLGDIAPEADTAGLGVDEPIAEALDLDSMDVLNFYAALDEELGVDVPESDYPATATLAALVAYLQPRTGDAA